MKQDTLPFEDIVERNRRTLADLTEEEISEMLLLAAVPEEKFEEIVESDAIPENQKLDLLLNEGRRIWGCPRPDMDTPLPARLAMTKTTSESQCVRQNGSNCEVSSSA